MTQGAVAEPRPGRASRVGAVEELCGLIRGAAGGVVFVDCQGLDSVETFELRKSMRPVEARMKVVKNRLMRIACSQEQVAGCEGWLKDNTAVVFVEKDPFPVLKALTHYAGEHEKLKLKGALIDGRPVEADGIKALAALPGREHLLTQVATVMKAPMTRMVSGMHGMLVKMALLLKEAAKKAPSA